MKRDASVVLDRDYPMTRRQVRVLAVGLAVMVGIGLALFGGLIPGLKPNYQEPTVVVVAGHEYFVEIVPLHVPFLTNTSAPWNVSFRNVSFELQLANWYSNTGGWVEGIGTESNGTHYPFVLGEVFPNGTRATLYVSPDSVFGASYLGGWLGGVVIHLLVETTYGPSIGPPNALTSRCVPVAGYG